MFFPPRSEAIPLTLPIGQNSPQNPAHGLYAEKFSGTVFTAPRHENQRTWLYRILPAAAHHNFEPIPSEVHSPQTIHQIPNQLRWNPFDFDHTVSWVESFKRVSQTGDPAMKTGLAIYVYATGKDVSENEAFYSAGGDFLIVPHHGVLDVQTERGKILLRANEICGIPRGVRYRVTLPDGPARGYICELYQGHFQLPELGPIGSNGLANARNFQVPRAHFDEDMSEWHIIAKFNNILFSATQFQTPLMSLVGTAHITPTNMIWVALIPLDLFPSTIRTRQFLRY